MIEIIKIFESFTLKDFTLFEFIEIAIFIASLGVIFLPRIVYSALCLGFIFINIALLFLLLKAEFLAAAQVLIYVGAITVLILFAIMLINFSPPPSQNHHLLNSGRIFTAFVFLILYIFLFILIMKTPWDSVLSLNIPNMNTQPSDNNVKLIGILLIQDFLLPFELISIFLLVALVGAINIARRQAPLN